MKKHTYYKPIPPRNVTCKRCSIKFYVKGTGSGSRRYGVECQVITYGKRRKNQNRTGEEGA